MFYLDKNDYGQKNSNEDLTVLDNIINTFDATDKNDIPPNRPPRLRTKHKPIVLNIPLANSSTFQKQQQSSEYKLIDKRGLESEALDCKNDSSTSDNNLDSGQRETQLTRPKRQSSCYTPDKRLCGYLGKLSSKAIIKNFRKRWFVFSPSACKLFYFRSAEDVQPIGEIDISLATFHFDIANKERPGLFTISAEGKEYCLEAKDRQECFYWLQELQRYRRQYSQFRSAAAADSSASLDLDTVSRNSERPQSGLLGNVEFPQEEGEEQAPASIVVPAAPNGETPRRSPPNKLSGLLLPLRQAAAGSDSSGHSPELAAAAESTKSPPRGLRSRLKESFRLVDQATRLEERWCSKCKKQAETLSILQDELTTAEDKLLASRELIHSLQTQLDLVLKEKESLEEHLSSPTSEPGDTDFANKQASFLRQEVARLRSQLKLYEDQLIENNKTIETLTNKIYELENSGAEDAANSYSDMLDSLQAYELQNKFLNKEIVELNLLRHNDEKRERKLQIQSSEWEARYCQTQSKLLTLLRLLDQPFSEQQKCTREMVQRLLEQAKHEPLVQPTNQASDREGKSYDAFGFNWKWGKDDLLAERASNLHHHKPSTTDSDQILWRGRWENFMVTLGENLRRSAELKALVRSGVPATFKGRIWKGCVELWVHDLKEHLSQDYYSHLVAQSTQTMTLDPAAKQIELDLMRTLPNNCHYESQDSPGIAALRRVLIAYSRRNPAVGYCQGINRLVAIALLVMDEEDAFWCLVAVVERIMPPSYYTRSLTAAQVDQRVLKDLMTEKMPKLAQHLESHQVDISLYGFNWFMTLFVDNLPVDVYLRIWDAFLYEGSKVLFRFALAFFKICEAELLHIQDYMAINKFLRHIDSQLTDSRRVAQIAFHDLNPFPMKMIRTKRAFHQKVVEAELHKLELLRAEQSAPPPTAASSSKASNDMATSEDDDED